MRAHFELATSNYWKYCQLLDVFASNHWMYIQQLEYNRWIMALTAIVAFPHYPSLFTELPGESEGVLQSQQRVETPVIKEKLKGGNVYQKQICHNITKSQYHNVTKSQCNYITTHTDSQCHNIACSRPGGRLDS